MEYYQFSAVGKFIRNLVRKLGPRKTSILITGFACSASLCFYLLIASIADKVDLLGAAISVIIPLSLAPFLSLLFLRVFAQIDRAETAIRESEAKYQQIVQLAPAGIYEIDLESFRLFSVNDVMCESTGYTREELLKLAPLSILSKQSRRTLLERRRKILAGEKMPETVEYQIRMKNGSELWFLSNARFIYRDGKPVRATVVAHDITEQKNAQKAVKESEEYHRSLFYDSPVPLFMQDFKDVKKRVEELRSSGISDLENYLKANKEEVIRLAKMVKVTNMNRAALKMYEMVENAGESEFYNLLGPGNMDHFADQILAFTNGEKWYEGEGKNVTFNGKELDILIRKTVMGNDSSDLSQILASVTDITEIKRSQREKENLERQLRHAQKMEAVGTLAGGIAHDFNNLLQAMSGYTELLILELDKDRKGRRELAGMQKAIERAGALTTQLLTFSRNMESDLRPVSLNDKINQTKDLLERTLPKTIDIRLILAVDLKAIQADPNQIEQIVMNIAVNARDAMPGGGVLTISTENATITENNFPSHIDAKPGEYALLTIADTGEGMDEKTLKHIFEPFYTTKPVGKGTGLGLSMVYGMVKEHGGFTECTSKSGIGSAFRIYLPVAYAPIQEDLKPEIEQKQFRGQGTLLLVDDEEFLRDIGKQMLGKFGYTVITESDGESAVQRYRREWREIDLVILDMMMPGMDGKQCLSELLKINPEVKAIIASGYAMDGDTEKELRLKTRGIIRKPYELSRMLGAVQEALARPPDGCFIPSAP
jgi:two-component system, cell cycle sensor histidine kinase and response regulator CckA